MAFLVWRLCLKEHKLEIYQQLSTDSYFKSSSRYFISQSQNSLRLCQGPYIWKQLVAIAEGSTGLHCHRIFNNLNDWIGLLKSISFILSSISLASAVVTRKVGNSNQVAVSPLFRSELFVIFSLQLGCCGNPRAVGFPLIPYLSDGGFKLIKRTIQTHDDTRDVSPGRKFGGIIRNSMLVFLC